MAKTVPVQPLEVAGTVSGNSPFTVTLPEAASQTFKKGAVLVWNGAHQVQEGGSDPTGVVGVAAEPATGTANSDITVWVANQDTLFVGNLRSGTSTAVLEQGDVGKRLSLTRDTTENNTFTVDKSDASNQVVLVVKIDGRDDVGDTNGRVLFIFRHGALMSTS